MLPSGLKTWKNPPKYLGETEDHDHISFTAINSEVSTLCSSHIISLILAMTQQVLFLPFTGKENEAHKNNVIAQGNAATKPQSQTLNHS